MRERCFEFFQHVAIDLGLFALDLQAYLLAQATAEVAHHAHLPGQHIGKWPHTAGQRGVIKHLGALPGLPAELIQLSSFFRQQHLGFTQQTACVGQRLLGLQAQTHGLELPVEGVQRANTLALNAF